MLQDDVYWRQRAKKHWYKDGDKNTKYVQGRMGITRDSINISGPFAAMIFSKIVVTGLSLVNSRRLSAPPILRLSPKAINSAP
jgi:uncharacterized membrane protein